MDDLISTSEAAEILGVTDRAVRWYFDNGLLAGRTLAGRILFIRADVEAFVKPKKTGRPRKAETPAPAKPAKPAKKKKK